MKKTKEIERMDNKIEKEIKIMSCDFERRKEILNTIANWQGDFDSLVEQFNNNDYYTLLETSHFGYDYITDNIYDAYEKKDWFSFLKFYIKDWLFASIEEDIKSYTDNIFRLWLETI